MKTNKSLVLLFIVLLVCSVVALVQVAQDVSATTLVTTIGEYHTAEWDGEEPAYVPLLEEFDLADYAPIGDPYDNTDYATVIGESLANSRTEIPIVIVELNNVYTSGYVTFKWYKGLVTPVLLYEYTHNVPAPDGSWDWYSAWSWLGYFPTEINEIGMYKCVVTSTWGTQTETFEIVDTTPVTTTTTISTTTYTGTSTTTTTTTTTLVDACYNSDVDDIDWSQCTGGYGYYGAENCSVQDVPGSFGNNYILWGTSYYRNSGVWAAYYDYCINSTTLLEYACNGLYNGTSANVTVNCNTATGGLYPVCSGTYSQGGACVAVVCDDSDGGVNYTVSGNVTKGTTVYSDECFWTNNRYALLEYSCNGDIVTQNYTYCDDYDINQPYCYQGECMAFEDLPFTTSCEGPSGAEGDYTCIYNGLPQYENDVFVCLNSVWNETVACAAYNTCELGPGYLSEVCYNPIADPCTDHVPEGGLKCDGSYGTLFSCDFRGVWSYLGAPYDCSHQTGYIGTCLGNVTPVYYADTDVNYTVLCEPDTANCTTEVVNGGWMCIDNGILKKCVNDVWVNYNTENCGYYPALYSGDCNNTYSNQTNATLARTTLCYQSQLLATTTTGAATTTTLAWSDTDNAITRGMTAIGETLSISGLVIWLILMLFIGGGVLYYTRDSGHAFLILIGAELFMLVVGTVLNIISVGIIIVIAIIGAGMAAFYVHKLVSGTSGG